MRWLEVLDRSLDVANDFLIRPISIIVGLPLIFCFGLMLACAQEAVIGSGVQAPKSTAVSYTGPGDIVSGAAAWYSCDRAYNAAYANGTHKLCNVRNTSTSETCDVLVGTNGQYTNVTSCSGASGGTAFATFCAQSGGTCAVTKAYDQSGNGVDASQSTAAAQPVISFSIISGHALMTFNVQNLIASSGLTSSSQPITISSVANVTSQAAGVIRTVLSTFTGGSQPQLGWDVSSSANKIRLYAGSTYDATASVATWHALQALYNGASSTINVDGTETTGNPSTGGTSTALGIGEDANSSGGAFLGDIAEDGLWPSGFSSGNRTSVCRNQQAWYGSGNFGATC